MIDAQAVVATGAGRVAFLPVQVPEPGAEEVLVRLSHSWISPGTEGSFVRGERRDGETPLAASDPPPFPHVPGYQKVGVVEWVGSAVTDLVPGDLVFATVSKVAGMAFATGGHVSPAVTQRSQVWRVPQGIEPLALSGLVLTQVGYNCGIRPALYSGAACVVLGDGLVGHWAAQTLAWRGGRVLLAGRHDARLAHFSQRPGDLVVNVTHTDLVAATKAWAGEGLQVVVDTVGAIETLHTLLPLMRRNGQLVSAGFHRAGGLIDIQALRPREITLHTPSGWTTERLDATLELVSAGALRTLPLITHHFPAARASDAFDLILNRREPALGIILDW